MPRFLLRIEGVDFATTLSDTDDLSTIRGASQAYLYLPERIAKRLCENTGWPIDKIVAGASIGIFRASVPDDLEEAAVERKLAEAITAPVTPSDRLDKVWPHLSFTWAAVREGDDYGADNYKLLARARARQLRRLSVDVPPEPTALPCHFDRRRPGHAGEGRITVGGAFYRASASVKARHDYGANERHVFYDRELDWADLDRETFKVTQSLQDIVDTGRSDLDETDRIRLPVALASKIAVVYLDGNKFTAIREATVFGETVERQQKEQRHRAFDRFVREERRRDLLSRVVKRISRDGRHNWVCRDGCWRLRFETLMWGGDESLFVLPAWAVIEVLPELMKALEGWHWKDGYTLSHAVGIAICNVKTPIAVARDLAGQMADAAKDETVIGKDRKNLRNAVSLQIFESVEPPRQGLNEFRKHLYGTGAARAFSWIGTDEVNKALCLVRRFQDEKSGLPRSQLYGLIAAARDSGLIKAGRLTPAEQAEAQRFLDDPEGPVARAFFRADCKHLMPNLREPVLGYSAEAPLLPLIRLAELWDYIDPFGATP
jgi:hypothetical protein